MSASLRPDRVDVDSHPKRSITPPPSPSRSRRGSRTDGSSFISVREVDCGPAQTFFDHRISPASPQLSCLYHTNSAASSSSSSSTTTMATALTLVPQPLAPHLGHCCPCGRLDAWKLIRLRGRCMSRSSEDLRLQHRAAFDDGEADTAADKATSPPLPAVHQPGKAPLEALPLEILGLLPRPMHVFWLCWR